MGKNKQSCKSDFKSIPVYNKKYIKAEKKKINTNENFQCFYVLVILIESGYRKAKVFLEKHNSNKEIEICSDNSYCVDFDEECYDEKCQDLFRNNKKNMK